MSAPLLQLARSALRVFRAALLLVLLTSCKDPSGLDDYIFSEAIVKGSARQENNMPVAGATVQVFAQWRSSCDGLVLPYGELSITTTDQFGNYFARSTIGPIGEQTACVTVRVQPPTALSLAETASEGLLVSMRANGPGIVLDTATINVIVRKK